MCVEIDSFLWGIDKKYLQTLNIAELYDLEKVILKQRYIIQFCNIKKEAEHSVFMDFSDTCLSEISEVRDKKYKKLRPDK